MTLTEKHIQLKFGNATVPSFRIQKSPNHAKLENKTVGFIDTIVLS